MRVRLWMGWAASAQEKTETQVNKGSWRWWGGGVRENKCGGRAAKSPWPGQAGTAPRGAGPQPPAKPPPECPDRREGAHPEAPRPPPPNPASAPARTLPGPLTGSPKPGPAPRAPLPAGPNPSKCPHSRGASQARGSRRRPQPSPAYLDARRPRPGGGCAGTRGAGTAGERASGSPHCSGAALHARPRAARSCCTPNAARAGLQPVSPRPPPRGPPPPALPAPAPSPTGAGSGHRCQDPRSRRPPPPPLRP